MPFATEHLLLRLASGRSPESGRRAEKDGDMTGTRYLLLSSIVVSFALGLHADAGAQAPDYLSQWGTQGSMQGQFDNPFGVATDAAGNVYVADLLNSRIQKFDPDGAYLASWGSPGSGDGQLHFPYDVAIDAAGNLYVADFLNSRVQKFDATGAYVTQWGSYGGGIGQFQYPTAVEVDIAGNVYVADPFNTRVQKFDGNGAYLGQWGSSGSGDGQFQMPFGIAVDAASKVYVTDYNRVQVFDASGGYLAQWGTFGGGPGQFNDARGIATDGEGHVYVVDLGNRRIQMFDALGAYVAQWGTSGTGNGQFVSPIGVATDAAGHVYVTDTGNFRVQKFGFAPQVAMSITLSSEIDLDPLGQWLTGYVQPATTGYDAADIVVGSIRLNIGSALPIAVDPAAPTVIGDVNGDQVPDLTVRFELAVVETSLTAGASMPVTVTGTVAGQPFLGVSSIEPLRTLMTSPAAGTLNAGTVTEVRWQTPVDLEIQSVTVLSSMDDGASWTLVASGVQDLGSYDWTVPAAGSQQARVAVVLVESSGPSGGLVSGVLGVSNRLTILAPTSSGPGPRSGFALHGLSPNPGRGPWKVDFSLADAGTARLDVLDVSGRRVLSREVGALGPGRHQVEVVRGLRAGVYLVRLTQGREESALRAVMLE